MKTCDTRIKNRLEKTMIMRFTPHEAPQPKGLVFILHGFSGSTEQPHIKIIGATYRKNGYNTLMVDATNSFNESDGGIEDANWTTQLHDLEDCIKWATTQGWYQEPFALAGHSLGAAACLSYAAAYPDRISHIFPAATVLSGSLFIAALEMNDPESLMSWKQQGYQVRQSSLNPLLTGHRPWNHIESDWMKYDIIKQADRLAMPVLLVVGEKDIPAPPLHQKLLFDNLPGYREMHVIAGADHNYGPEPDYLEKLHHHLDSWLQQHD